MVFVRPYIRGTTVVRGYRRGFNEVIVKQNPFTKKYSVEKYKGKLLEFKYNFDKQSDAIASYADIVKDLKGG
jgi:hypothetical protein